MTNKDSKSVEMYLNGDEIYHMLDENGEETSDPLQCVKCLGPNGETVLRSGDIVHVHLEIL